MHMTDEGSLPRKIKGETRDALMGRGMCQLSVQELIINRVQEPQQGVLRELAQMDQ